MAAVLLHEGVERCLAQAGDEDRFVVGQELHVEETAFEIQHHKRIDRRAGEAGQGGHRFGLEDIARLRPAGVQQLKDAVVGDLRAHRHGRTDVRGEFLGRENLGQSDDRTGKPERGGDDETSSHGRHVRRGTGRAEFDLGGGL